MLLVKGSGVITVPYSSERELELREKLFSVIVKSGLTYKETMSAINYVRVVFSDKGDNLLNGANIQEVAKQKRFIG